MISISVDKNVQASFDDALNEAMIYNKRTVGEICNSTLFFVVRNAIAGTAHSTNGKIRNDLLAVSRSSPSAPLAAVLVNYTRGQKGMPGLNGSQMTEAVEQFIKNRQNHKNFIRSRWIPANKVMAQATKFKAGAKRLPSGIKINGSTVGGAKPAQSNWKASGYIFAALQKIKNESTAGVILDKGLNDAAREETQSKLQYVLNKKAQEGFLKFNHS